MIEDTQNTLMTPFQTMWFPSKLDHCMDAHPARIFVQLVSQTPVLPGMKHHMKRMVERTQILSL